MIAALGPPYFSFQSVHKLPVIRQSRQCVVGGLVADLLLASFPLRDVNARPNTPDDLSGWCAQRPQSNFKVPVSVAVFKMRSHAPQCFDVLRNGRRVRILALQVLIDCPPDEISWLAPGRSQ